MRLGFGVRVAAPEDSVTGPQDVRANVAEGVRVRIRDSETIISRGAQGDEVVVLGNRIIGIVRLGPGVDVRPAADCSTSAIGFGARHDLGQAGFVVLNDEAGFDE